MTDPLVLAEHLVGGWDPDGRGWIARDHTAGPAGSAGLELPGDVELDVDVAEPSTLTGLWVPAGSPAAADLAVTLIGEPRARGGFLAMGDDDHDALRVLGTGDELAARRARRSQPGTIREGGVDSALAGLALALAAEVEQAGSRVASGLAALDAAVAALDLSGRLDTVAVAREHATRAAALLLAAAVDGEIDGLDLQAGDLADALGAVDELLDEPERRAVRVLRSEVIDGGYDLLTPTIAEGEGSDADLLFSEAALDEDLGDVFRIVPAAAPSMARSARAKAVTVAPILEVIDHAGLPSAFVTAAVAARATTASEIEVRVQDLDGPVHGWWVRAQRPDGVVLAVAPLLALDGDEVARLLVPPAALREVEVDITDTPGVPRPGSLVRRVTEAIAEGRQAARAERMGRRRVAAEAWTTCAEHWTAAGDPARAGLAMERAAGGSRALFPALLVDRVS